MGSPSDGDWAAQLGAAAAGAENERRRQTADGGAWAELGDEDVRHAFGGSAVVNDAFQKLKDELERVLGESVATAQEADRIATDLRHKLEEAQKTIDALRSLDESRERYVVWLKGLCGRAQVLLAGFAGPGLSEAKALVIDMQSL